MSDLGVTGNITAGLLTINGLDSSGHPHENEDQILSQAENDNGYEAGASLNTIGEPLRLQNLGVAGVDILDGKVTIDTDGNIESGGTIKVKSFYSILPMPCRKVSAM